VGEGGGKVIFDHRPPHPLSILHFPRLERGAEGRKKKERGDMKAGRKERKDRDF